jgi:tetratricopeptide (TPR) repeat protein
MTRLPIRPKSAFVALSVVVALALPILSFDFGVTEDEQLHNNHGKSILDYFLGRSDKATRHPIAPSGKLEFAYDGEMNDLSGALNIYGGFFDLVCVATHRYLSPFGEFENRHLVNSLFGVLLIIFTGLLARQAGGWRAGVVALLLMAVSPRIIGHSMNNPVDLPFAALYAFSIYFIIRFVDELPNPTITTWIPLLIGIALATDVRIAGLVLIFYLGLFACARFALRIRVGDRKTFVRSLGITALLCLGSYLLVSALWPLAHGNPLATPLMAFKHLSRLETFNAYDLFEGRWIDRPDLPWYFAPKWLVIGTPLFVPLGLLLSPLLFTTPSRRASSEPRIDRGKLALVAFTFLFPLLFVLLRKSYIYNDARHVLFVYPPLIVVCALAFERTLRATRSRAIQGLLALLLAGTAIEPVSFMIRNHPNENVYFSPLIGGVNGAWHRYETDFWGNSSREAVEWIQANSRPEADAPVRIRLWYGDQTKADYYIRKKPGYVLVPAEEDSTGWDYNIVLTVAAKYTPAFLDQWPIPGTVYEVKANSTPLCAVTMNFRNRPPAEVLERMREWVAQEPTHGGYYSLAYSYQHYGMDDEWVDAFRKAAELEPEPVGRPHDEYVDMGLKLHHAAHYAEAVTANRLALRMDPSSAVAHNNICAAHNLMTQWHKARQACEAALALEPDFAQAARNLEVAKRALGAQ